jgi:phage-related minor tail protein
LKDVDKLLKLDPGNTELLAQKQKLLAAGLEMRFLSKERHIL